MAVADLHDEQEQFKHWDIEFSRKNLSIKGIIFDLWKKLQSVDNGSNCTSSWSSAIYVGEIFTEFDALHGDRLLMVRW